MKDALEAKIVYVREAPTRSRGRRYIMADGGVLEFRGAEAPFHRKQIIITNRGGSTIQVRLNEAGLDEGNTARLTVGDSIGGYTVVADDCGPVGLTIFATSSISLMTSDRILIRNTGGQTQRVDVMEIFYL